MWDQHKNYSEDPIKNVIDSIDLKDNVFFCYQWLAETIHSKKTQLPSGTKSCQFYLPAEKWLTGGGDKDTKGSDEVNSEVGSVAQVRYMGVSKNRGTPKWMVYNL